MFFGIGIRQEESDGPFPPRVSIASLNRKLLRIVEWVGIVHREARGCRQTPVRGIQVEEEPAHRPLIQVKDSYVIRANTNSTFAKETIQRTTLDFPATKIFNFLVPPIGTLNRPFGVEPKQSIEAGFIRAQWSALARRILELRGHFIPSTQRPQFHSSRKAL